MPNGRTHSLTTLTGAVVAPAALYLLGAPVADIAACGGGFLFSLWVNPDLDLNNRLPWRNPKKLLWKLYWWPYSKLIPHRSPLSHTPLLGTALRVIYLLPFIFVFLNTPDLSIEIKTSVLSWFLAGLAFSDIGHILLDVSTTAYGRWQKR